LTLFEIIGNKNNKIDDNAQHDDYTHPYGGFRDRMDRYGAKNGFMKMDHCQYSCHPFTVSTSEEFRTKLLASMPCFLLLSGVSHEEVETKNDDWSYG
jgi:hypothetical protein